MATIKITNLHSTGCELFYDSESFLNELTDEEQNVAGGIYYTWLLRKMPPFRPPVFWA
ncbi:MULTISPECIES: hypothetical protein [Cyanophyceae]|uniref:hypothetical protein n=1 Tax=Cyanophyceae TaxID=3028117 RepID=UPI001685EA25|nr:hypothetical protein [Trichocoleus sp. FACHB-40]MBD2002730.1 hypothetical protein [Trichocoleus sp. FACHB-40]